MGKTKFNSCLFCDKKFKTSIRNEHKYCSHECYHNAQKRGDYRSTNILEEIQCSVCGIVKKSDQFKPKYVMCKECQLSLQRERRKEKLKYYKEHPDEIRKCARCKEDHKLSDFLTINYCRECAKKKLKKEKEKALAKFDPDPNKDKKCRTCGKIKKEIDFYPLQNACKKCSSIENVKNRDKRFEKGDTLKTCPICKKTKTTSEFHKMGYCKECTKTDPILRLNRTVKGGISKCLKRRNSSKDWHKWEEMVGYTAKKLKKHLEKQFTIEMSWDNYGSYWHIDHIIPLNFFNFQNAESSDFKRAWALKNLRPLKAEENLSKGDKLLFPCQITLGF